MNRISHSGSLLFLTLFTTISVFAQTTVFYDIPDFLKIAGGSEKKYEFSLLHTSIEPIIDFGKLNFNYYYLSDSAGKREAKPYQLDKEYRQLYEWAGEGIMLGISDTAILIYQEVLDVYPEYSPAITGIGQAWQQLDNHTEAIQWFRKAIQMNPIDYMAWWGIALSYDAVNFKDSASAAISTAWILNRNSLEIVKDVRKIYHANGYKLLEWHFVPQYSTDERDNKVKVIYNPSWMGYAVCQAVWKYERNFVNRREIQGDMSMFKERECLSCLLTGIQADEPLAMKDPALKAFKKALQQKHTLDFLLFEIMLPENPDIAYLLDAKKLENLIDYIYSTRRMEKNNPDISKTQWIFFAHIRVCSVIGLILTNVKFYHS